MPDKLLRKGSWEVLRIDRSDIRPGDLFFTENPDRLISHVAIVAHSVDKIFHSTFKKGGGCVQPIEQFFEEQLLPPSIECVLTYRDKRSNPSAVS